VISKRTRYDSGQYAILPRPVINNAALSFDARGLLLYLLEKPADWSVSNEELYRASPDGERHINTLLAELKAHGYVHREKVYDPPTRTFRWDTIVYDFPEDNPHFDPTRIPTFRMDTKRTPTKRKDTKRSDDLILDPLIDIKKGAAGEPEATKPEAATPPAAVPVVAAPSAPVIVYGRRPDGPSRLEREGYSPEPPTRANVYPARPPLLAHVPLSLRAMELSEEDMRRLAARPPDELYAPSRYHQGERGVPLVREEALRLWMLTVLGIVCGVQLRTGRDDSAADPLWPLACDLAAEGVTPPQVWLWFAAPGGYWLASADHAWKGRRPTAAEVKAYWGAAREWKPAAGASSRRAAPEAVAAAEAAWEAVLRGVRQFNDFRNAELEATLDATTRAALSAFGGIRRVRAMDVQRDATFLKRQFISEYQTAAGRLAGASSPSSTREPQPIYAAA
jgi:hypothetical protein